MLFPDEGQLHLQYGSQLMPVINVWKNCHVIIRKAENIPTEFMALGEEVLGQNVVGVSYLLVSIPK